MGLEEPSGVAIEITSYSPESTRRIGFALGSLLKSGDVLCLMGPLGAGKTCLVQGIVRGLHPEASYPVRSPSFTIIAEYPGPVAVYHVDLFRLEGKPADVDIGVEELLESDGCCLIEWADRCPQWIPEERLDIYLTIEGLNERRLKVETKGERWNSAEEEIRRVVMEAV